MVRGLLLTACAVTLGLPANALGQRDELRYEKRATRDATRRATLARYMPDLKWSPWHLVGPFDNTGRDKHDVIYPPEIAVDLAASYRGKDGRNVAWQPLDDDRGNPIELARFGTEADNTDGVAYLYRECVSDREARVSYEMGSDDGLKLWLNGRLLVDADAYRGLNVSDHLVELPFRAERNTLLVKVTQGVGAWQFQMRPRLDGRMLALLQYRLDQDFPPSAEARHYRMLTVLEPEDVVLEVGGLDTLPDGRPIVATRRGEVWIIEDAYEEPPFSCDFKRFASGLHEPLGLRVLEDGVYTVQRGELTRLVDVDGDDRADRYETVSGAWGVSGNYHEFAFGPKLDGQGRLWVTLNLGFCGSLGKSEVPWRGWALIVNADGSIDPVCGGLRSPNGLGRNAAGDMFYTDNQGDWVGTNKLAHLDFGDWHGHESGKKWYAEAGFAEPTDESYFKPPAVWFPYGRMGQSASDILLDDTEGVFGPFHGQLFVGDQTNATVMRVFLERVDGVYQGACFPFREGFDCGVNRMCFAPDGSMFVGMTNRGWGSLGRRSWGLQRLVYTGEPPFEIATMEARPDGFELTFTEPVDPESVVSVSSFTLAGFTYLRHLKYGSPEVDRAECVILEARVTGPSSVRLVVDGLRAGYVHELVAEGVRSAAGEPLLHAEAYYTLNAIP
ncbi:MAG: hypothetical protein ACYS0D_09700 [Planctomycetota bacterium]|jgi:hypothetical protein